MVGSLLVSAQLTSQVSISMGKGPGSTRQVCIAHFILVPHLILRGVEEMYFSGN